MTRSLLAARLRAYVIVWRLPHQYKVPGPPNDSTMNRFFAPSRDLPKAVRHPVTPGSGGTISRILGITLLVVLASALIASVTMTPSKRNITVSVLAENWAGQRVATPALVVRQRPSERS